MANSGAQTDNIYWHYTPNINYSVGLDYQQDKERYLDNIWKIIDWDVCNERL